MTTPLLTDHESACVDAALDDLAVGESAWAGCRLAARRELLEQVHRAAAAQADTWVRVAAAMKGLPVGSPLTGEEWLTGPYAVLTATTALCATIRALEGGRSPVDGFALTTAPGGRVAVRVLPHGVFDRILLHGFSAEVWMPPGVNGDTVRERAGLGQRHPERTGGISVVLGAGNVTSIPVLDVLYELYAHNRAVALKLNPFTDPLLPVFSSIFAPLIEFGVVRIITGGADVGAYLAHHPRVRHVHMTGSTATHDAIVFGVGPDGARRKKAGTPALDKSVTSELGGVSGVIVLPGRWSGADLRYQAGHIATQRLHNGGYNCVAAQIVVLSADWENKGRFVAELRAALARAPDRPAYYPGSYERVRQALTTYPDAERLGPRRERVFIPALPDELRGHALKTEYFAPVLAVIEIPGDGESFLSSAVRIANEELAGTLGVNIIAHPRTLRQLGTAFGDAVVDLRFGTIGINAWTGVGYMTATARWGAFPGHTLSDVQSGIGVVHNALLLDGPERTVVRGPFRPLPRSILHGEGAFSPRPPWFVANRTAGTTGRRLTAFAARPRVSALPGILGSALRG